MSVIFYTDVSEDFKCSVKIEGTEYSKTKTRLILEFPNKTLMFPGTIDRGNIVITVPALSEIDAKSGTATLEVIADSTYFEAWTSKFNVERKKNIQISEVTIGSDKPMISVEILANAEQDTIHKEVDKPGRAAYTNRQSKPKKKTIFKESCSQKNMDLVTELFKQFKTLNESDTRTTKKELKNFEPSKMVQKWADTVFVNSNSSTAKYCMMKVQKS